MDYNDNMPANNEAENMDQPPMEETQPAAPEVEETDSFSSLQNSSKRFDEDEFMDPEGSGFGTDITGIEIDRTAELKQDFAFSKADLSMILDKFIEGDARIIADENNGSAFERISGINNYPGAGNRAQGHVDNAVAQYDEDNIPTPAKGDYIQILAPDGTPYPNSRQVSNTLGDQGDSFTPEETGYNNLFMGVGQYIDHGLDLIPKGEDKMTVFLPKDDPLRNKAFDFQGNPVKSLSLLNAALPNEGTEAAGEGEYTNAKTPFADQDQTYGAFSDYSSYLREKDQNGEFTARLIDSSWSRSSDLNFFWEYNPSPVGAPNVYDVLINSAHRLGYDSQEDLKEAIDCLLNNNHLLVADEVVRVWDSKVRGQELGEKVTGNPMRDQITLNVNGDEIEFSVIEQLGMLEGARVEFFSKLKEGSSNGADFEAVFDMLVGDRSHLAKYSPFAVVAHKVSGDPRTNENLQLTAISEVFQKNHNHLVSLVEEQLDNIAAEFDTIEDVTEKAPGLEHVVALAKGWEVTTTNSSGDEVTMDHDEAVFAIARTVNNAAYQRMIYDQYVVHLSGGIPFGISSSQDSELMPDRDRLLPQELNVNEHGFNGIHPEVNPNLSAEFAGTAFRVGHSQIYPNLDGSQVELLDEVIKVKKRIETSLIEAFVNPKIYNHQGGAAGIIAANAHDRAMAIDTFVVGEVRNMLVGVPGDLLAFNIARGNEMGMPTLNEFRQAITDLFKDTGVGNVLGDKASDVSAGVFEHGSEVNEFLKRMKPYQTWKEFSENLRDSDLVYDFMALYGGPEASLENSYGLNNVPLYVGGLAEKQVKTPNGEGLEDSLMGSTFSWIVIDSFDRLQDPDEEYYKISIPGSDILKQLGHQTWTAMIQTSLEEAAQVLHQDTFRVARVDTIEEGIKEFTATNEQDWDGTAFNRIITGNQEDNVIKGASGDPVEGSSASHVASDDIRGGDGDDDIDGLGGEDWLYGQAGQDTLKGGSDHDIDHLFGGDGDDTLYGEEADALFGENDNDVLIRKSGTGFHDGGLGHDVVLAGDSIDVVSGDSGAEDSQHVEGDDILFGGDGDDEVAGRGGDDFIAGDGSNGDSSTSIRVGDRLYGDAAAPTHNAELLARAWESRDEEGKIVDTIVPLKSELGYGVVVGGLNPLTGKQFTSEQVAAFREYIEGLREVVDADHPGQRGPRPTMVMMPYAGPTGNDTIYTGKYSEIESLLDGKVDSEELTAWQQRNGYIEAPAEEAVAEEAVAEEAVAEEAPVVVLEEESSATDLVFADAGDDTIYTDGDDSAYVFGGMGYDTLYSDLKSEDEPCVDMTLEISSLNSSGADGVVKREGRSVEDHFFSMEHIVLDRSPSTDHRSNSLTINDQEAPVTINLQPSQHGRDAVLTSSDAGDKALEVSYVNHFDFSRKEGFQKNDATLKLAGKIDYDGILDSNTSDDNYSVSWDGESLNVKGRTTGTTSFEGIENVVFNYPTVDNDYQTFYYKKFADKALELSVDLVKEPVFSQDEQNDIVLRQFGTAEEMNSNFYLALTAKSLREASIDTLDVSLTLDDEFFNVFDINPEKVHLRFTEQLSEKPGLNQARVEVDGNTIRFAGSGLSALGLGEGITDETPIAYVELQTVGNIDDLIKDARTLDQYGFMNQEGFSKELSFTTDANVDSVVFSDLYSLRDLGDQYALVNNGLDVTLRAAQVELDVDGHFDLGTQRQITKPGEGYYTNLIRAGETIVQTNTWTNNGEFTLNNLSLMSLSNDVAHVTAELEDGQTSLDWQSPESVEVTTTFNVSEDAAGQILSTSGGEGVGYKLSAKGDYSWDTREISEFQTKHLVTYQGDLDYNGSVGMSDLAFLNQGAAAGTNPSDVDADFNGTVDWKDLRVIDKDWNKSLHTGDDFAGFSDEFSVSDLFNQGSRSWDSSAFTERMAIETGMINDHESAFVPDLDDPATSGSFVAKSLDNDVVQLWEQQYGTETV